ncbi:MgtC/SapB family protein [Lacrimispora sp. BS-2]|uniref:MgtC/SapB family protein n=1 Tax=Lacrimispora sp. BS-2 TaxID=3151850 RepID=A0AAU7PQF3_9FIRM
MTGFRTYMLVCMGSAAVMMTNQYIYQTFGGSDPSRLGAQVISGIGFLGAGIIIVTKNNQVRGLTTAAGLWAAACAGLAVGIGFYKGAMLMGLAISLIMTVFQKVDNRLLTTSRIFNLYMNFNAAANLNLFLESCKDRNIQIIDMQAFKAKGKGEDGIVAIITLKTAKREPRGNVLQVFGMAEGLKYMEEL